MSTLQIAPGVLKLLKNRHEMALLMLFISLLDEENMVVVNQTQLVGELKMKPASVSGAIRRLIESQLLSEGPKVGTNKSYRVSYKVAWRDTPKNRARAEKDYLQQERMKAANITGVIENNDPE